MSAHSSSVPHASEAQKAVQSHHRKKRSNKGSSGGSAPEHEFSASYVNTHIRHKGYVLHTASSATPTTSSPSGPTSSQSSKQDELPSSWNGDEDDNLDDEQGAEWEEWSCEQKNGWIEKEVRGLIPCIRANYVLPTAHRVNTQGDSSVWEGYGGIALMYFVTAYKILQGLPTQSRAFVTSPSSHSKGTGEHSHGKAAEASSDLRAEQQLHVQRQYAISLLQEAHDYCDYTLRLIDKQLEDAQDDDSGLTDEDRHTILLEQRRCSFIRSRAGALALGALIAHHRARYLFLHPVTTPNIASKEFDPVECLQQRRQLVEELLQVSSVAQAKGQDDEFFNGRAGYLYALNLVHSHLLSEVERMEEGQRQEEVQGETKEQHGEEKAESKGDVSSADQRDDSQHQPTPEEEKTLMRTDELHQLLARVKTEIGVIHRLIVASGSQGKPPARVLKYEWHGKEYYGAAHGTIGILHQLLQSPPSIVAPCLPIIVATTEHLLSIRFKESGNLPSSASSDDDRLVQWCHGAPGLSLLCSRLHAVTGEGRWLQAAIDASEVVWSRGLLKKGVGLCHGIGGNAYAFLALYQRTKDETHLRRAYHFVHFSLTEHRHRLFTQPDRPYSLYNGQAGLVCLSVDAEQAHKVPSTFPGYDLLNPRETLTSD